MSHPDNQENLTGQTSPPISGQQSSPYAPSSQPQSLYSQPSQPPVQQPPSAYRQPVSSAQKPPPINGPSKSNDQTLKYIGILVLAGVVLFAALYAVKLVALYFVDGIAQNWGITGIVIFLAVLVVIWAVDKYNSSRNRTKS